MALAAGTKLGPYEILSPIGAGGMGEVYRARDPRLHREVAVAILAAGGWALEHFSAAPPATTPVLRYKITPPRNGQLVLGTNPSEGGIALSPDATNAAIVATVDGKTGLWLSPSPPAAPCQAAPRS